MRTSVLDASTNSDITIRLAENPTTGYRWVFDVEAPLEMISNAYEVVNTGVGAAGTRAAVLRSSIPGVYRLGARLVRSWGRGAPIETQSFLINVV